MLTVHYGQWDGGPPIIAAAGWSSLARTRRRPYARMCRSDPGERERGVPTDLVVAAGRGVPRAARARRLLGRRRRAVPVRHPVLERADGGIFCHRHDRAPIGAAF